MTIYGCITQLFSQCGAFKHIHTDFDYENQDTFLGWLEGCWFLSPEWPHYHFYHASGIWCNQSLLSGPPEQIRQNSTQTRSPAVKTTYSFPSCRPGGKEACSTRCTQCMSWLGREGRKISMMTCSLSERTNESMVLVPFKDSVSHLHVETVSTKSNIVIGTSSAPPHWNLMANKHAFIVKTKIGGRCCLATQ